jgi:hypothetical protein
MSGWGLWGLVESVKKATTNLGDILQEDLKEFTNTIAHDTKEVVSATAEKIGVEGKEVTRSISEFVEKLSAGASPELSDSQVIVTDRVQAELARIRRDVNTYTQDPPNAAAFASWSDTFDFEQCSQEITNTLASDSAMRELYAKLVPVAVTHLEFWKRYFFRVFQIQQEEAKRKELFQSKQRCIALMRQR